jgi:endonuclease/exonuclease/phosphatase family metal-dependent hydrolase
MPRLVRVLRALSAAIVVLALFAVAPAGAAGPGLSVGTYNIHHGVGVDDRLDLDRVARDIRATRASVVGLQEVDRHWSQRSALVDQATWLAGRLRMHVAYAANLDLDPLEPGQPRRQYGTAILSKHPITAQRTTLLPRPEGGEQRGLLEVVVDVNGTPVRVANTHLQHNSAVERAAQVSAIVALLATSPEPSVLVGDLNAVPGSPELAPLYAHWLDSWLVASGGDGFTYPAEAPDRRIDYVFVPPGTRVTRADVRPTLASDHLPYTVRMRLP